MELADSTLHPPPLPTVEAFERDALVFLPNVARYARLLTRDLYESAENLIVAK